MPGVGERRDWYVASWPPLAWVETGLKAAGILVGVAALITALDAPADRAGGWRLAAVVLLAALSLGLVAAIADRVAEREVVGVVFVLAMNVGHWGMTVALFRDSLPGLLVAFAALMLAGDVVKLVFLARSGFTVRNVPREVVYALTGAYALGYAALILMAAAV